MITEYIEEFNGKAVKTFNIADPIDTHFVYRIESQYDVEDIIDKLQDIIHRDLSEKLEELIIGAWREAMLTDCKLVVDFLIKNKKHFSALKHIFIGDIIADDCELSWIQQINYEKFLNTYSQLESFMVRGGVDLSLGNFTAPNLKVLVIETAGLNGKVIEDIANASSSLSNLELMQIWIGPTGENGGNVTIQQIQNLLSQKFPKLVSLGLLNCNLQDQIATLLKNHSIIDQLQLLDLSFGTLTDDGAKALLENEKLLNLQHINCQHHFITDEWVEKLNTKFSAQNINLEGQIDSKEEDWIYVAVDE